MFNSIPWLKAESQAENSYFRTACLRIVQLLLSQKRKTDECLNETQDKSKELDSQIDNLKEEIGKFEKEFEKKKSAIEKLEIDNSNFKEMSQYKSALREFEDIKLNLNMSKNDYEMHI